MTPKNRSDLISRLEAATGPDRELDADIWDAVGQPGGDSHFIPYYTESPDAAVTLAKGQDIDSFEILNDCGSWFIKFDTMVDGGSYVTTRNEEGAGDAALVFCEVLFKHLAALKARETSNE